MLGGIKGLFEGLFTVFKHLFKRPVTLEYPEKKRELNDNFRGKPVVEGCMRYLPEGLSYRCYKFYKR